MTTLASLSSSARMQLPKRAFMHVPDAAAVALECQEGSLWITVDHDTRDTVLQAGQRFTGSSHRHALVYALEATSLCIHPAPPA